MSAVKITEGIYSVGIQNPNMRVFDIVMKTDSGTTYNSYLVRGSEKTALIETCHEGFFEQYLENIHEVCPLEEIDYIIMNHNEPDHSGSLAKLLELMPNAKVLASQAGSMYIRNITNRSDLEVQKVKDGETLDLGNRMLTFLFAPNLHWPDSMFTWVEDAKTLFTCDFLGCHYCEPYTFDYNIAYPKAYDAALELYYAAIFGPFGSFVRKGLEKIKALPTAPEFVCTSHGPVLTKECRLPQVLACYEQWSAPVVNEVPLIPIFYCSPSWQKRFERESWRQNHRQTARPTILLSMTWASCTLSSTVVMPLQWAARPSIVMQFHRYGICWRASMQSTAPKNRRWYSVPLDGQARLSATSRAA